MTPTQQRSIDLVNRITDEQYYIHVFLAALQQHNVDVADIYGGITKDAVLVELWNTMWYKLPDAPEIRTGPFLDLCDLAEGIFDDDIDDIDDIDDVAF